MARTRRDTLKAKRKRGLAPWDWHWLSSWPKWHDDLHHTKPSRRLETALLKGLERGLEPIRWPDHKKPHEYFWILLFFMVFP
jgi:hypothetical protein